MFDFLDKYHENNKISEGLFDKIFGKSKSEPVQSVEEPSKVEEPVQPAQPAQPEQPNVNSNKPKKEFERNKVYEFDLTKIPILGRFTNPIINLSFKSPEEFKAFKAILFYLNSGYFDNDINNLKRAIKYKEIDGYGQYNYLSSVFNNNKGTVLQKKLKEVSNIKFNMPKNSKLQPSVKPSVQKANVEGFTTNDSLRRLEKFVKYFVENIVDLKGVPNNSLRNSIIIRLKKLLGTNISAPKKVNPISKPASLEPGAKPEDLEKGGEETIDYALKGLKESVRRIIKDNF